MKFLNFFIVCDAPNNYSFRIQDPCTPAAEGMIFFHNYLLFFLITIGFVVIWFLIMTIINSKNNITLKTFTHSSFLEIGWTILPAILLLFMAVPSFCLLYSLDELSKNTLTLKIVGHQWYWSYEYIDSQLPAFEDEIISFDSYIIDVAGDLTRNIGSFRLLEVDNRVILPIKTHIKLLITSGDVLHSWAVPSFGVKVDACPGRLSEASLFLKRKGVFYGQCSEICGINHGFMPIVVRGTSFKGFLDWMSIITDKEVDEITQDVSSIAEDVSEFQAICKKILLRKKI
jgi:cytochrome c oxidase subunit 2